MFENITCRGFLSVIGAFFVSLGVGFMYLWGIIVIYATSYFRITSNNEQLTQQQTDIAFPLIFLGQAIAMPLAARFIKKTSSRMMCLIGGCILSAILYMSSYTHNFPTFAGLFGFCSGIIIGIIYVVPIYHCHKFFPRKKNIISAIIISASGIGTLIFAYIAYGIINPNNISIELAGGYFGTEQAMLFPNFIRTLSGLMLAFVSGGSLLLFDLPQGVIITTLTQPLHEKKGQHNLQSLMEVQFNLEHKQSVMEQPKNPFGTMNYEMTVLNKGYQGNTKMYGQRDDLEFWPSVNERQSQVKFETGHAKDDHKQTDDSENKTTINQCPRVRDAPKQMVFWVLFFSLCFGTNFSLLISGNYKTYAKNIINDDKYLTTIGAVGAVVCGLSRFIWGFLIQKVGFKTLHALLLGLNTFLAFTIVYIVQIKEIYFLYVMLAYICYGGHLGLFPGIVSQIFGVRYSAQIYGIMFYAYTVSNFVQFFLMNLVQSFYGYIVVFGVSGLMSAAALLAANRTSLQYDWSIRIRQHNQRKRQMAR